MTSGVREQREREEKAVYTFAETLQHILPEYNVSMTLHHNQHLGVYETVRQSVDNEVCGYEADSWISLEEMQKAIDTNECWYIQWYPDTATGFYTASASTLSALLSYFIQRE